MSNLDIEKLYNAYFMQVYSYTLNIVKDPGVAEEITQETFYKAIKSSSDFEGKSHESTWLCAIAKNLCYDFFRKEKKQVALDEIDKRAIAQSSSEHDFIASQTSLAIHRVLHTLEEPYKEVFELRVFGELSFFEIASIFSKSESWARVTYHRARLKIQERLASNESDNV